MTDQEFHATVHREIGQIRHLQREAEGLRDLLPPEIARKADPLAGPAHKGKLAAA